MTENSQTLTPELFVVATPIGNLGDITLRAIEVLRTVALIACEDTRVSGKLLAHLGIRSRLISYNDHNAAEKRPELLNALESGKRVALISDAGTPLISDPGYKLVKEAIALGIRVTPIPGVSSVTAALSVCGLPTDRFLFAGFLPPKAVARAKAIAEVANVPASLVILESAKRLPDTVAALAEGLGNRDVVIARELTKFYEELRRGTLQEIAAHYANAGAPKGEVVIVIAPPEENAQSDIDPDALLAELLRSMSVKDAASHAATLTSLSRQELYARALKIKAGA